MVTHTHRFMILGSLVILAGVLIAGCQMIGDDQNSLTGPNGNATELMSYAQDSGSMQFEDAEGVQYQLNVSMSQWPSFPFGEPFYLEINQQIGWDLEPGENQVPVTVSEVTYTFGNLPAGYEVKVQFEANASEENTLIFVADESGIVEISLTAKQLSEAFGSTSLSVWLTVDGGEFQDGMIDITLSLTMTMSADIEVEFENIIAETTLSVGVKEEVKDKDVDSSLCAGLEIQLSESVSPLTITCDDADDGKKVSRERLASGDWDPQTQLLAGGQKTYEVEVINSSAEIVSCDLWFADNSGYGKWHRAKPNIEIGPAETYSTDHGNQSVALVCED